MQRSCWWISTVKLESLRATQHAVCVQRAPAAASSEVETLSPTKPARRATFQSTVQFYTAKACFAHRPAAMIRARLHPTCHALLLSEDVRIFSRSVCIRFMRFVLPPADDTSRPETTELLAISRHKHSHVCWQNNDMIHFNSHKQLPGCRRIALYSTSVADVACRECA